MDKFDHDEPPSVLTCHCQAVVFVVVPLIVALLPKHGIAANAGDVVGFGLTVTLKVFVAILSLSPYLCIVEVMIYVLGLAELVGVTTTVTGVVKLDDESAEILPELTDQSQLKFVTLSVGVKVTGKDGV